MPSTCRRAPPTGGWATRCVRQLEAADLLVLNKVDSSMTCRRQRCAPGCRAPTAPVLEARHADVPLEAAVRPATAVAGLPAADDAGERFRSWSYDWAEPVEREALLALLRDAPADVLRAKGIVRFADAPDRRAIVHMVGRRIDVSDDGPWSDTDSSRLVLLGVRPVLGSRQGRERQ